MSTAQFRLQIIDQLSDYVRGLAWTADGHTLAAISAAGEVVLWTDSDRPNRQRVELQGACDRTCDCVGFSANHQFLAVGGEAGLLQAWDLQSDLPQLVFKESYGANWIEQLAWHPVQEWLAIPVNRTVQIWDLSHQKLMATLDFETSTVLDLAWHPTGQYLAVSGQSGVKVWDVQKPENPPVRFEVPGASLTCRWSAEGQYLASGNLDRTLSVLAWGQPPPWLMQGFPGKVSSIAWSDSSSPLLAAACVDGITVWQRKGNQWSNEVLAEHQGFVKAIAFQPNSQLLASGSNEGGVLLWHKAKKVSQTLKPLTSGTACLAWHPSGNFLAGGSRDGKIMIWTLGSSKQGFG
ncbi:WD40 repeat domain-containing protein [Acaryochloris sp. IP29b_bin.148]|uniref:WD40 repeat domain-containing protein n=1 Tax=Acaryochloris sp. IP29b_bin.148 TaxID=2969218 RepID=UPI0026395581|nr:WD40 repeat domain-containing protein [Acaryochloris sp. IP29b_bin.148]